MSDIPTISVHELKRLADENPDIWLIDVREDTEWHAGYIKGAIHIPKDTITEKIKNHVPHLDMPVYIYCGHGRRSLIAAEALYNMGFEEVYSVEGGITAWKRSGFPIERK